MKYTILILAVVSFVVARLVLWLVNPSDPEGTNLLVTTMVAVGIFVSLLLVYRLGSKKQ